MTTRVHITVLMTVSCHDGPSEIEVSSVVGRPTVVRTAISDVEFQTKLILEIDVEH